MSPLASAVFAALQQLIASGTGRRPVLAINGPVGAGKTTLGRALKELAAARGLALAVASIDDLYLPLEQRRQRLAGNPFGVSRVPPGSHDPSLLLERLEAWRAGGPLRLPRFDKRLAGGEGDRSGEQLLDAEALVLEGWLLGCRSLGEERLEALAPNALRSWPLSAEERLWLPHWDRELSAYEPLWAACDGLWLIKPQRWCLPRRWRFQAEARQRRAGGGSLRPEALDRLVRASLNALPPPLYIDPIAGSAEPAAQRAPVESEGHSACASGCLQAGHAPSDLGCGPAHGWSAQLDPMESGSAEDERRVGFTSHGPGHNDASIGWRHGRNLIDRRDLDDRSDGKATEGSRAGGVALPLLGLSVLDSRRRVLQTGAQPSLSSASSAIG